MGRGGFKHLNAPPPIDGFCPIEFLAKGMTASTLQPGEQLERVLAANLGLARTVLTGFRKENLERGADWRYEREVILTAKGTEKLRSHFALDAVPEVTLNEGIVKRWSFRNQRILELENGDIVRVSNNQNFRPGMVVKYRKEGPAYVLDGRTPRFPGKW